MDAVITINVTTDTENNRFMRKFLIIALASLLMLPHFFAYSEDEAPTRLTFRVHAPHARSVEVVGDFNAWQPGANFLQGPDDNGLWRATIAIQPGMRRIEYVYLLNGRERVLDPLQLAVDDDFHGKNNVVLLP